MVISRWFSIFEVVLLLGCAGEQDARGKEALCHPRLHFGTHDSAHHASACQLSWHHIWWPGAQPGGGQGGGGVVEGGASEALTHAALS